MREQCLNVGSGMIIAWTLSQLAHILAPYINLFLAAININYIFVWNISPSSNLIMTIVLTIVSICRGYAWRRYHVAKEKGDIQYSRLFEYGIIAAILIFFIEVMI